MVRSGRLSCIQTAFTARRLSVLFPICNLLENLKTKQNQENLNQENLTAKLDRENLTTKVAAALPWINWGPFCPSTAKPVPCFSGKVGLTFDTAKAIRDHNHDEKDFDDVCVGL